MTTIDSIKAEFVEVMSVVSLEQKYRSRLEQISDSGRKLLYHYLSTPEVTTIGTKDKYDHMGEILEEVFSSGVLSSLLADHRDLANIDCHHDLWWILTCVYAKHIWPKSSPNRDVYWHPELPFGNKGDRQFHHLRVPMIYYVRFRPQNLECHWSDSHAPHLFSHKPGINGRVWDLIVRSSILNNRESHLLHRIVSSYIFDDDKKKVVDSIKQHTRVFIRTVHELRVNFAIEKLDLKQADDLLTRTLKKKSDFYSSKRNARASSSVW